ncbi:reverse transcriptase domain-containing protein [Tanacetum coccineum]
MCDASDFAIGAVLGQRIDWKFKTIYYASKTLNNALEYYTTTEKELLSVVISFDKFPKPNDDEPRYADYVNYIVGKIVPPRWTPEKRRSEILEILAHCHSGPTGGHHSASITRRKVYESGFFWPSIFKDARDYVMRYDACQRLGNISSRREMPQNNIQDWSEKLNDTLWAFRTAYKTPMRYTPFRLVYGTACHLPMEIEHKAYWALKQCSVDLAVAAKNRFVELNELMELRDGAYRNT